MTAEEIGKKLIDMGKKAVSVQGKDNAFLKKAGLMMIQMCHHAEALEEKILDLEERLAIREEMDHEGDPEIDAFPPEDAYLDAAAPGAAAEDFWADDWPLEP